VFSMSHFLFFMFSIVFRMEGLTEFGRLVKAEEREVKLNARPLLNWVWFNQPQFDTNNSVTTLSLTTVFFEASSQPSVQPSGHPLLHQSSQPTTQPSSKYIIPPSSQPTIRPTKLQSSSIPSRTSIFVPTSNPSLHQSFQPTTQQSSKHKMPPSSQPIIQPSKSLPSSIPSKKPQTSVPTSLGSIKGMFVLFGTA
jgi:hypothetical protein